MTFNNFLDILWFIVKLLFWAGLGVLVFGVIAKILPEKKDSDGESKDIK
jgi:hypothetical protein